MRRVLALLCCLLASPSFALSAAQEIILLGGSGQSYYASPAATGKLPPWLSYASAGVRYYFDAAGSLQTSPNNLLLWSNDLTNGVWLIAAGIESLVVGGAYDGANASSFTPNTSSQLHRLSQSFQGATGVNYIVNLQIKGNGVRYIYINTTAILVAALCIDTTTGSITTSGSNISNASATALPNGWWAVSYKGVGTGGTGTSVYFQANDTFTSSDRVYADNGTNQFLISRVTISAVTYATTPRPGDQVITGATPYFGPVVNDHNPSTLAALGLRSEPQRTNLFLNNLAPVTQTTTVVSGTVYTVSFFGTGSIVLSGAATQTMTGSAGARSQYSFTASSTSLTATVSGLSATSYTQVEANAFATSPILTYGTAVTVPADNWSFTGAALARSTAAACVAIQTLAEGALTGNRLFEVSDGTVNNRVALNGTSNTLADGFVVKAGTTIRDPNGVTGGDMTTAPRTSVISYGAGVIAQYAYDGTLGGAGIANTAGSPSGMTQALLGQTVGGPPFYGWYQQIMIRPSCTATQVKAYSTANSNMSH